MDTPDLFSDFEPGLAEAALSLAAPDRRLRARAVRCGLETLDERDVLALILGRWTLCNATVLAEALLKRFGDLQHVLGAPHAALASVVGAEAALELQLVHEVGRRILFYPMVRRNVISSWSALLSYLRLVCAGAPRELFRVLFLDKKNQLIADEVMGEGTLDHAPVYPREVVRRALELNACAIILCHQHPSGDPTPSSADVEMTRRVVEASRALSIAVHDHIVVGGDSTASFKALGLM